jgi:hypothetical protein
MRGGVLKEENGGIINDLTVVFILFIFSSFAISTDFIMIKNLLYSAIITILFLFCFKNNRNSLIGLPALLFYDCYDFINPLFHFCQFTVSIFFAKYIIKVANFKKTSGVNVNEVVLFFTTYLSIGLLFLMIKNELSFRIFFSLFFIDLALNSFMILLFYAVWSNLYKLLYR